MGYTVTSCHAKVSGPKSNVAQNVSGNVTFTFVPEAEVWRCFNGMPLWRLIECHSLVVSFSPLSLAFVHIASQG